MCALARFMFLVVCSQHNTPSWRAVNVLSGTKTILSCTPADTIDTTRAQNLVAEFSSEDQKIPSCAERDIMI